MSTAPRVLVVQSTPTNAPRRFGDWWRADGLRLDIVRAYDDQPLPERLTHDALVVLGGGFMPDDDARAPWLAATRALTAQALDAATPMLGICLGGQLLAHVAGGVVRADAGAPERGSTAITMRPEAATDPLFAGAPSTVTAFENHVDAIDELPPGAVWLAATQRCPHQAFRVGPAAWGTQFHPEVSTADVANWSPHVTEERQAEFAAVVEQMTADDPKAEPVWREVARRFADEARRHATARGASSSAPAR